MNLKLMWGGFVAYFFVFWYAVGDFALAIACTFFLVLIGAKITFLTLKGQASARPTPLASSHPQAANLDQPPPPKAPPRAISVRHQ